MTTLLTNIQKFELKRKIQELKSVRGEGTTLVSIAIKAGTTVAFMSSKIRDEIGIASNIKSAQTSKDVCDALESASGVLKKYAGRGNLENGLFVFAGNGIINGKEKRFNLGIEPPLPCPSPLYRCENHFKIELLEGMLIDNKSYGFIIIDRGSCFFGLLNGDEKKKLEYFTTDVPNKHNKGGQSQNRMQRLRIEKIHFHMLKCAERAKANFMDGINVNVEGIILAGQGDLKIQFLREGYLSPELLKIIVKTIDVSYSGEAGFSYAIEHSCEVLDSLKYIQEKKIVSEFFDMLRKDDECEKICYGFDDMEKAISNNALKKIIIWDELPYYKITIKDDDKIKTIYSKEVENEFIIDKVLYIDWITQIAEENNIDIEYISDHTEEGAQFKSFGGVGGILHWSLKLEHIIEDETNEEYNDFI
jgi:peptide chain release factor subunit 1